MNPCHTACSDNSSVSLPQRLVEALGRLQAHASSSIFGSIYIYDLIEQRTLSASCSVATMLGYCTDDLSAMGENGLASLIHPDDLASVSEHYQRFSTLQSDEVIAISYRMRRADGSWCCLRSVETPCVIAIDGFPLQILGMIQVMAQVPIAKLENLSCPINFLDNVN